MWLLTEISVEKPPVLELSNFRWGGWVFESSDQLAAERNLPIIIQQGRNHASKVGGSESGEARIEGAKRLRFEGEARIEGEARERAGGGVWGGARWAPPQKIFGISNFKSFNLVYSWKGNPEIIDFS